MCWLVVAIVIFSSLDDLHFRRQAAFWFLGLSVRRTVCRTERFLLKEGHAAWGASSALMTVAYSPCRLDNAMA